MIKLLLILFLSVNLLAQQTRYYVDDDASSGGNGTIVSPWDELDDIINYASFNPGDTVSLQRGDTFFINQVAYHSLRLPVNNMTLNGYGGGARPIVSGGVSHIYKAFQMARQGSYDWRQKDVTIIGIQFQDGQDSENGTTFSLDGIDGTVEHNFYIDSCIFDGSHSFENATIGSGNFITDGHPYGLTIKNSVFQNTKYRAGLYINNFDDILLENNTFQNCYGYDTWESSPEGSGLKFNDGHDIAGGNCTDVTIRDNLFLYNHYGIRIGSLQYAKIYDNIFIGEDTPDYASGACINVEYGEHSWGPDSILIWNNTIVMQRSTVKGYGIKIGTTGSTASKRIYVKNNIIYCEDNSTVRQYFIELHSALVNHPMIDNNLWFSDDSGVRWADNSQGSTTKFSTWQSQGHDSNGTNADPYFANYATDNFSLTDTSNSIGIGTMPLRSTDRVGNFRDISKPSAGAYE